MICFRETFNSAYLVASLWLSLVFEASYVFALSSEQRAETPKSMTQAAGSPGPFVTPPTQTTSDAVPPASGTDATEPGVVAPTSSTEAPSNSTAPLPPANSTMPGNSSDPSPCHRTYEESKDVAAGPFCEPHMYQDVLVGKEYPVTWDPSAFNLSVNVTVLLKYAVDSGDGDFPRWNQTVPNERGFVKIPMEQDWLLEQQRHNLSISMKSIAADGKGMESRGTVISLVGNSTTSPSSSTSVSPSSSPSASLTPVPPAPYKSSDKVGMGVGIPLGIIFLLALIGGLFLVLRKRRRGYLGSRRRTAPLTGDDFRTTRSRGDSFKDEPVQDVELQPRNGHQRGDSMSDFTVSPVSDIEREGSNAFRDEIARQRAGADGHRG